MKQPPFARKGEGAMWALLGLLASINTDLAQVAINADVAKEGNFRVPVSDSVRAQHGT